MNLFLTDNELTEQIRKKQRSHARVKVLRALGIEHKVPSGNSLLVSC